MPLFYAAIVVAKEKRKHQTKTLPVPAPPVSVMLVEELIWAARRAWEKVTEATRRAPVPASSTHRPDRRGPRAIP